MKIIDEDRRPRVLGDPAAPLDIDGMSLAEKEGFMRGDCVPTAACGRFGNGCASRVFVALSPKFSMERFVFIDAVGEPGTMDFVGLNGWRLTITEDVSGSALVLPVYLSTLARRLVLNFTSAASVTLTLPILESRFRV